MAELETQLRVVLVARADLPLWSFTSGNVVNFGTERSAILYEHRVAPGEESSPSGLLDGYGMPIAEADTAARRIIEEVYGVNFQVPLDVPTLRMDREGRTIQNCLFGTKRPYHFIAEITITDPKDESTTTILESVATNHIYQTPKEIRQGQITALELREHDV